MLNLLFSLYEYKMSMSYDKQSYKKHESFQETLKKE